MVCYFTSVTANYIAKARVLGKTLKNSNPEAKFYVVLSDILPNFINLENEPFDVVLYPSEFSRMENYNQFTFKHTITELCTAVKPMAALEIFDRDQPDGVIYLDPDIAVLHQLTALEQMFESSSILLTPHQRKPEILDQYIRENEILFLKRGTYNFGFFGVKNDKEGHAFLDWWNDRLKFYCFDDDYTVLPELRHDGLLGMFTDQKWADLIPSYFENYKIIKDSGYNVCTWNLNDRVIKRHADGTYTADEGPLYFFHFSGYDSGGHKNELQKRVYFDSSNKDVLQLSEWYGKQLKENGQDIFGQIGIQNLCYSNGVKIQNFERKLFHIRKDIYDVIGDPYEVTDALCFYHWVREEYPQYFSCNHKEVLVKKKSDSYLISKLKALFPGWTRRGKFVRRIMCFNKDI